MTVTVTIQSVDTRAVLDQIQSTLTCVAVDGSNRRTAFIQLFSVAATPYTAYVPGQTMVITIPDASS